MKTLLIIAAVIVGLAIAAFVWHYAGLATKALFKALFGDDEDRDR